ncbi:MAG: rhodanese-related sulfurtransferase [Cyanobacteria bacterium]|nr:rhodanese-related sulfurtransferase [Cyanobacteriota bacterium]
MTVTVATFYKFVALPDCEQWQSRLQNQCVEAGLRGTILLAQEGINATVAGDLAAIDGLLATLRSDPRFGDLTVKESTAATPPFGRMKVKIKREIVTLGQPEADPTQTVGTYVPPEQWNALIQDPEVVLIDARNDYEVGIGTFEGAINPSTDHFRQLPDYLDHTLDPKRDRKVAMFCTGGIRCEKATAYLRRRGFEAVYHLQGGILKYLETVPETDSLWRGECFVFDERVAVRHGLEPGSYDMCRACGHPISATDKADPAYVPDVSCPHCVGDNDAV